MRDALIPVAALVRRELIRTLRQNKAVVLLALLVGISAICIVVVWPMPTYPVFVIQSAIKWIPGISIAALFFAAVTILPGQAATCIRSERDKDTLDLLLLTRISPFDMFAGHLANILGLFLLYTIATLPIVCSVYLLAGLDWYSVPAHFAVIAVTALTCTIAGLICTAFARSTIRAVIGAYVLAAFMLGGYGVILLFVLELIAEFRRLPVAPWSFEVERFLWCTPPAIVARLPYSTLSASAYLVCIGTQLIVILVGIAIAWIGFRRLRRERAAELSATSAGWAGGRKTTGPEWKPFADGYNAVIQREWRVLTKWWRSSRRLRAVLLFGMSMIFLTSTIYGAIALYVDWDAEAKVQAVLTWILSGFLVVFLVAPGASTPLWIRERDMETREQLIMTLLGTRQIIYGKAAAAWVFTMVITSAWLMTTAPVLMDVGGTPWAWTTVLGALFALPLAALTLVAIGSQTPLLRVKSPMAIVLSYVFGFGYVLLPLFFSSVPDALMLSQQQNIFWTCLILGTSPVGCWGATASFDPWNGPLILKSSIPLFVYYAGALVVQSIAVFAFLKDSIRVEGSKIRRGEES